MSNPKIHIRPVANPTHASPSVATLEAKVAALREEIVQLESKLGPDKDAEAIVKSRINLLHEYNERKDAAQILIGRVAVMEQTTVTDIYKRLDLDLAA